MITRTTGALIMLMAVTSSAAARGTGVVWVEAERFADRGGWTVDRQFIDTMGSPYLLANAIGNPVADAVTTVPLEESGTYRLWVRCRDWLPEHSPGTFQVQVNGRASATRFGTAVDDGWRWVDGGEFELAAGDVTLRLHDLTGWWGRCDAIVLSNKMRPSDDADELAGQRVQYGGLSSDVDALGPYDVVVVGGGLAGCSAAIAAARHGASVALIQDRPVLGGNASSEIGVAISGDTSKEAWDPGETGIIEELDPDYGERRRSAQFEAVVRAESAIDLHLNTRATGVDMADGKAIAAVLAVDVGTGKRMRIAGRAFVDCTGDGWVGAWAGAHFRRGREGRDEFNEPGAPRSSDHCSLSTSLTRARLETRKEPVSFTAPAWAYRWTSCEEFDQSPKATVHSRGDLPPEGWYNMERGQGRHPDRSHDALGTWWLEFGGVLDTIKDGERIRDELLRIKLGLWDHVKNHCAKLAEENRCREFVWTNHIAGKRESRRLLGDYVLSQQDYITRTVHPDTVFYAGYNVDPHHPQGFWTKGPQAFRLYHYKVSVPYRILYSRNIENLFMAGRNVSATHLAFNGVRVMRTTCMMGQVVGTAATVAKAHGTTPRGVYERHIGELQQTLLRDGCYLMGVANSDPADLARQATVTASSTGRLTHESAGGRQPHGGTLHTMDADRAVMFTGTGSDIEAIEVHLKSTAEAPVQLTATLCSASGLKNFASGEALCQGEGTIPAGHQGWVSFPLHQRLEAGRAYYVWLPATEGVSWELYPSEISGTARAYRKPSWTPMSHCYKFRLVPGGEPVAPEKEEKLPVLAPENVINGWNRAVNGEPNAWAPASDAEGPHWLQLSFEKPVRVGALHVTFQLPEMSAWNYDIVVREGDMWRVVYEVRDSHQRRRVSRFTPVQTRDVRIVLRDRLADAARVRICEVRIYGE